MISGFRRILNPTLQLAKRKLTPVVIDHLPAAHYKNNAAFYEYLAAKDHFTLTYAEKQDLQAYRKFQQHVARVLPRRQALPAEINHLPLAYYQANENYFQNLLGKAPHQLRPDQLADAQAYLQFLTLTGKRSAMASSKASQLRSYPLASNNAARAQAEAYARSLPLGRLFLNQLFGPNLKQLQFKQQPGSNTCYLLSALEGVFRHPNGETLLQKIQISKTGVNSYRVQFPGQAQPTYVNPADLQKTSRVKVSNGHFPGLPIIEAAYLKLPGVTEGRFDNTRNAMARIFGARDIASDDLIARVNLNGALKNSTSDRVKGFIDLFTATEQVRNPITSKKSAGAHYYSLRQVNLPDGRSQLKLVNPFDTADNPRMVARLTDLQDSHHVEMTRIWL